MNIYIIALYFYSKMQAYVPYISFSLVLTVKLVFISLKSISILFNPSMQLIPN